MNEWINIQIWKAKFYTKLGKPGEALAIMNDIKKVIRIWQTAG